MDSPNRTPGNKGLRRSSRTVSRQTSTSSTSTDSSLIPYICPSGGLIPDEARPYTSTMRYFHSPALAPAEASSSGSGTLPDNQDQSLAIIPENCRLHTLSPCVDCDREAGIPMLSQRDQEHERKEARQRRQEQRELEKRKGQQERQEEHDRMLLQHNRFLAAERRRLESEADAISDKVKAKYERRKTQGSAITKLAAKSISAIGVDKAEIWWKIRKANKGKEEYLRDLERKCASRRKGCLLEGGFLDS